jgi:acyl-CoA synthetase (AMP-forming)/AMP-acid ligase II
MREFGVPALTAIPASARLTDTVFRRAGAEPGVVVLRRRTGAGITVLEGYGMTETTGPATMARPAEGSRPARHGNCGLSTGAAGTARQHRNRGNRRPAEE